jgi:phosphatidylserine/phosphatidylglycerophosphate/cardiolipin synthase-like enzyme
MSKKLVVLLITLTAGWLWASEPATSSTSTSATDSTLGKRQAEDSPEASSSTSASSTKRARKIAVPARVQAHFAPQEQLIHELSNLLDNVQKQVLVAMYILSDEDIIRKLTELKTRNIDVQIIFDETSLKDRPYLVNYLLRKSIVPIVYPSDFLKPSFQHKMHNKFLVVDKKIVLTGSANFSKSAFQSSPTNPVFNYENIIIVNSNEIAQEYNQVFSNIKEEILMLYIQIIVGNNPDQLPQWMKELLPRMYERNPKTQSDLNDTIYLQWPNLNAAQKNTLKQFFKWNPPSLEQKKELRYNIQNLERMYSIQNLEAMSSQHAYKLIGELRKKEKAARVAKRKLE